MHKYVPGLFEVLAVHQVIGVSALIGGFYKNGTQGTGHRMADKGEFFHLRRMKDSWI